MEPHRYNRAYYENSSWIYETSTYTHSIKSDIKT